MRHFKLAVAGGTAALLVAGAGLADAAAATTHPGGKVALRGGHTTVTTGKGIAEALLANDIVPIAISPGAEALQPDLASPVVTLTFPVTGGRVGLSPLGGYVNHSGGILFFNTKNDKDVAVSDFTISLKHADLTGIVNGNPRARVVVLWLNLSHAKLKVRGRVVTATNIGLTLSAVAAGALDTSLGTTIFTPGLALGTASTQLRI